MEEPLRYAPLQQNEATRASFLPIKSTSNLAVQSTSSSNTGKSQDMPVRIALKDTSGYHSSSVSFYLSISFQHSSSSSTLAASPHELEDDGAASFAQGVQNGGPVAPNQAELKPSQIGTASQVQLLQLRQILDGSRQVPGQKGGKQPS